MVENTERGERTPFFHGENPEMIIKKHPSMNICTYNILAAEGRGSDGCNRLEQVMRCMRMMNIDLGVLTETKLVRGRHTVSTEGFEIVTTEAKSKHQGGVALFYRKSENFHVEGTKAFGPNVIGTTLVSGRRRWRIVGAYIPPSEVDGSTLDFIQAAVATTATTENTVLTAMAEAVAAANATREKAMAAVMLAEAEAATAMEAAVVATTVAVAAVVTAAAATAAVTATNEPGATWATRAKKTRLMTAASEAEAAVMATSTIAAMAATESEVAEEKLVFLRSEATVATEEVAHVTRRRLVARHTPLILLGDFNVDLSKGTQ